MISSWISASAAFDLPGVGMAISTDTCKPSISSSGVLSASLAFLLFRERKESHEGGGSGVTKGDVDQAFVEARGESPGGCGLVPRRIAGLYVGVAVMRAIPRPPTATKFGKKSRGTCGSAGAALGCQSASGFTFVVLLMLADRGWKADDQRRSTGI